MRLCTIFLSTISFFSILASGQNTSNVELLGQVNRGDTRYSGSWAYVAPDSTEYALIGAKTGTAAYCINDDCDYDASRLDVFFQFTFLLSKKSKIVLEQQRIELQLA